MPDRSVCGCPDESSMPSSSPSPPRMARNGAVPDRQPTLSLHVSRSAPGGRWTRSSRTASGADLTTRLATSWRIGTSEKVTRWATSEAKSPTGAPGRDAWMSTRSWIVACGRCGERSSGRWAGRAAGGAGGRGASVAVAHREDLERRQEPPHGLPREVLRLGGGGGDRHPDQEQDGLEHLGDTVGAVRQGGARRHALPQGGEAGPADLPPVPRGPEEPLRPVRGAGRSPPLGRPRRRGHAEASLGDGEAAHEVRGGVQLHLGVGAGQVGRGPRPVPRRPRQLQDVPGVQGAGPTEPLAGGRVGDQVRQVPRRVPRARVRVPRHRGLDELEEVLCGVGRGGGRRVGGGACRPRWRGAGPPRLGPHPGSRRPRVPRHPRRPGRCRAP